MLPASPVALTVSQQWDHINDLDARISLKRSTLRMSRACGLDRFSRAELAFEISEMEKELQRLVLAAPLV